VRSQAIALLSGGLNSTLAVRLILDQGIEVETLNFVPSSTPAIAGSDVRPATSAINSASRPA